MCTLAQTVSNGANCTETEEIEGAEEWHLSTSSTCLKGNWRRFWQFQNTVPLEFKAALKLCSCWLRRFWTVGGYEEGFASSCPIRFAVESSINVA